MTAAGIIVAHRNIRFLAGAGEVDCSRVAAIVRHRRREWIPAHWVIALEEGLQNQIRLVVNAMRNYSLTGS